MKIEEVSDVFDILNSVYKVDQSLSGDAYLKQLIENISKTLDIQFVLIGRPTVIGGTTIKTDFAWAGNQFIDNFEYDLKGTPCANVMSGKRVCIHASDVFKEFPEDLLLGEMGVEAYVGAPIITPENDLIGLLVLLDTKIFKEPDALTAITEFFANRVAVEIARKEAELKLKNINKELEEKVKEKVEIIERSKELLLKQEKLASLGRVISGVAHEIRNPLNFIINANKIIEDVSVHALDEIETIERRSSNCDISNLRERLGMLGKSNHIAIKHGSRLKKIIENMLAQSPNQENNKLDFDLKNLLNESIEYAYHGSNLKMSDKRCEIVKNFPAEDVILKLSTDIQSLF